MSGRNDRHDIMKATISRRGMLGLMGIAGAGIAGALAGCSTEDASDDSAGDASTEGSTIATVEDDSAEVLVAYFSATGNTRAVAERLADDLGATLFEIVPEETYTDDDLDFNNDDSRVVREHEDESERDTPLVQTTPDGFESYTTILLGYPIWWGEAAWPVDRFVTDNDFTDKTIYTFCTSQSSGIGDTTEDLAEMAGTGEWVEGERFDEDAEDADIDEWADSLDL
jgi:hypothetical protein